MCELPIESERAEVAVYQTGGGHAIGEHHTIARPSFSRSTCIYFGHPLRVLIACLRASGSTSMAKRWYIIHAYSNFENKVADSIREQAKHRHLDHLFEEIIVQTEKLVDVRHGQKHATERKFFPGYVLAKMELTDEAYHLIRNTPKSDRFPWLSQKADTNF